MTDSKYDVMLSLVNNSKIRMSSKQIIFLGTGAAEATKYFNSCFYIKEGEKSMLVDTGGGNQILSQLEKSGIALEDIEYVYITHKHIDHLMGIFWILRFLGSKISKGEAKNLTVFCSEDIANTIKQISLQLLKKKVTDLFGTKILLEKIENYKQIHLYDWKLTCLNIQSTKDEQYGFRLEFADGTTFINLGDEPFNETLLPYAENADYILHDAFCLEKDKDIFNPHDMNHSTVTDAAGNATQLQAKNLILFHSEDKKTYGQRKSLYTQEARQKFSGNIFVPDDLEAIDLD